MKNSTRAAATAATILLAVSATPGVANAQSTGLIPDISGPLETLTGSAANVPLTGSDNFLNAAAGSIKSNNPGQTNDAFTGSIGITNPVYGSMGTSSPLDAISGSIESFTRSGTGSLDALTNLVTGSTSPLVALGTTLSGSLSDTASLKTLSQTVNGSLGDTGSLKSLTETVNGSLGDTGSLKTLTETVNGSLGDTGSLKSLTETVNGSLTQNTASQAEGSGSLLNIASASQGTEGGGSDATAVLPLVAIGGSLALAGAAAAGAFPAPALPPLPGVCQLPSQLIDQLAATGSAAAQDCPRP